MTAAEPQKELKRSRTAPPRVVVLGAGLHGSLFAGELALREPELPILLVDENQIDDELHSWCVHAHEIPSGLLITQELFDRRFDGYEVIFDDYRRRVDLKYCYLREKTLRRRLEMIADNTQLQLSYADRRPTQELTKGISTEFIWDFRPDPTCATKSRTGWQKFFGLEMITKENHGLKEPILMDAKCEQFDGYRFFYTIPIDEHRLLVEETFFSNTRALDLNESENRVSSYAREKFGTSFDIERREHGLIPMPWAMAFDTNASRFGSSAGFFNPATGYSLGSALSVIDEMMGSRGRYDAVKNRKFRARWLRRLQGSLWMNRGLFTAIDDMSRSRLFAQIFRKSDAYLGRIFSMKMSKRDALETLAGPIPKGLNLSTFIKGLFQ